MCMVGLSQQQRPQLRRRACVWPQPQNWFRLLIANPALHFLWKEHFRVTHETFEYLCDLVRADLQTQKTQMRAPISVEETVGLALWRLATGNSYRSCGLQFGYGKSTAKYICSEFEHALLRMKDQFVKFPLTRQEITDKIDEFEETYASNCGSHRWLPHRDECFTRIIIILTLYPLREIIGTCILFPKGFWP